MAINKNTEELDFLKKELEIHKKNLGRLNLQKAKHGSINVPLHILNQIEDEENEIKRLKKEIEEPEEKEKRIKNDEKDAVSHEAKVSIKTGDISGDKVVIAGRDVHIHQAKKPQPEDFGNSNPPQKRRNKWFWVIIGILVVVVGIYFLLPLVKIPKVNKELRGIVKNYRYNWGEKATVTVTGKDVSTSTVSNSDDGNFRFIWKDVPKNFPLKIKVKKEGFIPWDSKVYSLEKVIEVPLKQDYKGDN